MPVGRRTENGSPDVCVSHLFNEAKSERARLILERLPQVRLNGPK